MPVAMVMVRLHTIGSGGVNWIVRCITVIVVFQLSVAIHSKRGMQEVMCVLRWISYFNNVLYCNFYCKYFPLCFFFSSFVFGSIFSFWGGSPHDASHDAVVQ